MDPIGHRLNQTAVHTQARRSFFKLFVLRIIKGAPVRAAQGLRHLPASFMVMSAGMGNSVTSIEEFSPLIHVSTELKQGVNERERQPSSKYELSGLKVADIPSS